MPWDRSWGIFLLKTSEPGQRAIVFGSGTVVHYLSGTLKSLEESFKKHHAQDLSLDILIQFGCVGPGPWRFLKKLF